MTKDHWFRETDVSDINANLLISESGGDVEASFQLYAELIDFVKRYAKLKHLI